MQLLKKNASITFINRSSKQHTRTWFTVCYRSVIKLVLQQTILLTFSK